MQWRSGLKHIYHCCNLTTTSYNSTQSLRGILTTSLYLKPKPTLFINSRYLSVVETAFFLHTEKFKRKDKVPKGYDLIYRLKNSMWCQVSIVFSYFTMIFTPTFFLYDTFKKEWLVELSSSEFLEEFVTRPIPWSATTHYATFFLLTFLSFTHYIFMIRHPLRVYFNGNEYIGVFMHRLLPGFKTSNYKFVTVKKARIPSITFLPMFWCGNRKAKLHIDGFRTPHDYFCMTKEIGTLEEEE